MKKGASIGVPFFMDWQLVVSDAVKVDFGNTEVR